MDDSTEGTDHTDLTDHLEAAMRILLQSAPDKFDATLVELRKLVAVPDEIASEIREAHSAQYDKTNEHAQKKRQTTTIKNPYKKPPPPNPFTIAAGDPKL